MITPDTDPVVEPRIVPRRTVPTEFERIVRHATAQDLADMARDTRRVQNTARRCGANGIANRLGALAQELELQAAQR